MIATSTATKKRGYAAPSSKPWNFFTEIWAPVRNTQEVADFTVPPVGQPARLRVKWKRRARAKERKLAVMNNLTRISLAASAAAGALLLSGCVVAPAPYYTDGTPAYTSGYGYSSGYGYGYPAGAAVYAPVAPPAPYMEVQPAIPFTGAIWIGGYWNWSGGRYSWVPGRYERPRAGYRYEPRRWTQGSRGGWQMSGGWRRR
jgi:hypothetical protein